LEATAAYGHPHVFEVLLPRLSQIRRNVVLPRSLAKASAKGHISTVQYLLNLGTDVNSWEPPGSALHLAANSGFSQVVRVLLDHGADPNHRAGRYGHPLFFAARNGHMEVVQILLKYGADVDTRGDRHTVLARAARNGELAMVKFLLKEGVDLMAYLNGDHALEEAAQQGHEDMVKFLVWSGVDVNGSGRHGDPPIVRAMVCGQQHIVKILSQLGARDPDLSEPWCQSSRTSGINSQSRTRYRGTQMAAFEAWWFQNFRYQGQAVQQWIRSHLYLRPEYYASIGGLPFAVLSINASVLNLKLQVQAAQHYHKQRSMLHESILLKGSRRKFRTILERAPSLSHAIGLKPESKPGSLNVEPRKQIRRSHRSFGISDAPALALGPDGAITIINGEDPSPTSPPRPVDPAPNLNITELSEKGVELDRKTYISRDEYEDGNIQQKFKYSYTVKELDREGVLDQVSNSDLKPVFDDLGVTHLEDVCYQSTEISSKNSSRAGVTETKVFAQKGIIVREYFSPENDLNAPGQRLNLSDLTFILWKDATGDKRVERLQAYVIRNLVSKTTLELLQKAEYHDLHSKFFTTTFTRTDRDGRRAVFDMLMGTDEISALTYMLKDHAPVRYCLTPRLLLYKSLTSMTVGNT
ncbi:MAG: hypothetical protein Q9180_005346, partial [Flavoplaca navasiana]